MGCIPRRIDRLALTVVLAAAGLLAQAQAQVSPKTVSVEVSIQARALAGRTGVEAPVDQVTLTHLVSYEDLNLATQTGAEELGRRVAETARFACEQLERLYPRQSESIARCTRQAIEDTDTQVSAAIEAADRETRGE
jgi:UrcA family protein